MTPLTDTDGDLIPDTGPLNPGKNTTVIVEVTVPAAVNPGDADTAVVRFTSSNDLTRFKESKVTTTVPPPGVAVGPRGYFTPHPGATVNATMNVRNTGGFADTIDMTAVSDQSWTIHLYQADGHTPLADTDGDRIPDVGLVPGLQSASIVVLCVCGLDRSARDPRRYLIAKNRTRKQISAVKKTVIAST